MTTTIRQTDNRSLEDLLPFYEARIDALASRVRELELREILLMKRIQELEQPVETMTASHNDHLGWVGEV